jgi:dihydroorotate dehydrogenase
MYNLIKSVLFQFDAEKVHHFTFQLIKSLFQFKWIRKLAKNNYTFKSEILSKSIMGLTFPNPVGLAAGFDKDAKLYKELSAFGFGFIEIGTLTPKPQDGNPKPRLFRLPQDEALINRMGFNNGGVDIAVERLKNRPNELIVGGNIGKNKVTPNENAMDDYTYCFEALYDSVDYFVVNVSSPNTPNLRDLQEKEPLTKLLNGLQVLNQQKGAPKPILLKIAPDLTDSQLDDIIEIVQATKINGVIATNTTIDRSKLKTPSSQVEAIGAGGVSGKPLTARATEVIKYLKTKSNNAFVVVGVGGIQTGADAIEKLEAGADLLQVYSGFIYGGPATVKRINKEILEYYKKIANAKTN